LHTEKVIQENAVAVFIKLLASNYDDVREQAVWALGNIAGDSTKCRNFVLKSGVLPNLLKLIAENPKISLLRNATWTLSNLCRGKPIPEFSLVSPSLSVLKVLLYSDDDEILTDSCWAISYLSDGPNDRIQAVIDAGVVGRLTELLQHNQTGVQTPALRTIGNIVTGTDNQTQIIIKSGALQYVGALLKHQKKSLRKEACWTISNITAGNKDQIQSIIDANLIPGLIQILEKDEFEVKKEAAWAISNATSGGTIKQIYYLVERGCIKPLCDLLEEKDVKIVNVALEGLENILNNGAKSENENPFCEMIEEAGGIEKIENLQHHENNEIYEKSSRIIEQYFYSDENDDDEIKNDVNSNNFNFDNSETNDFNF
jgi:importin subunit alpha-6/7